MLLAFILAHEWEHIAFPKLLVKENNLSLYEKAPVCDCMI